MPLGARSKADARVGLSGPPVSAAWRGIVVVVPVSLGAVWRGSTARLSPQHGLAKVEAREVAVEAADVVLAMDGPGVCNPGEALAGRAAAELLPCAPLEGAVGGLGEGEG